MKRLAVGTILGVSLALASSMTASGRDLTFEERVKAQEAIERVYYSQQSRVTRTFEEVFSREVLERIVRTYLKQSVALEELWGTPVTGAALRREVERMSRGTIMPDELRRMYAALDNDAFLIEECLGRKALVDRLARNFFAFDQSIHEEVRRRVEAFRDTLMISPNSTIPADVTRLEIIVRGGEGEDARRHGEADSHEAVSAPTEVVLPPEEFQREVRALPLALGEPGPIREERDAFVFDVVIEANQEEVHLVRYTVSKIGWNDWWEKIAPRMDETTLRAAAAATGATTQSEVLESPHEVSSAPSCDPEGTWADGVLDLLPDPRFGHTSIWSGTEVIIWGGYDWVYNFATGGRYDPLTDTWRRVSTVDTPSPRADHSAVWTGDQMVVWGGQQFEPSGVHGPTLGDGARYDPAADTWTPISALGAPSPRYSHSAVWTGTEMIVWGGQDGTSTFDTGGRYDPETDTWSPIATVGAPSPGGSRPVVWTGTEMIVGGGSPAGARYDPASDSWRPISTIGAHGGGLAVWTGDEMIVWHGATPPSVPGGRYNPSTDTWQPIAANSGSGCSAAVWTGTEMILFGGLFSNCSPVRYDPKTDSWSAIGEWPPPRADGPSAVWTGSLMVTWGGTGFGSQALNTGWRYSPTGDSWTPTSTLQPSGGGALWADSSMIVWGAGVARYDAVVDSWSLVSAPIAGIAVWTGEEVVWWNGQAAGGRYDPLTDLWQPIANGGPSTGSAAFWTGREALFWGGSGGLYDPAFDTWRPMSDVNSPDPGYVAWTGLEMIVLSSNGGARYDPTADLWTPISTVGAPLVTQAMVVPSTRGMIVWGGKENGLPVNTGARYDVLEDSWTPMSTGGAPSPRFSPGTAVWTGKEMVIWGGGSTTGVHFGLDSGGRYDPTNDAWAPVSMINAPVGRIGHTAMWTGTTMIVWGGYNYPPNFGLINTGGGYVLGPLMDDDADGYTECQGDCDDADSAMQPGASETCNGVDDNCDGQIDEDGVGLDSDDDDVLNACDNCRLAFNPDQFDADHDAVGNACDNCITVANLEQLDIDQDGRGNVCDNCASSYNPFQDDFDQDARGDVCDNCIFDHNPGQSDFDHDHEGDLCDLDDGLILIVSTDPNYSEWQGEDGYQTWNSYRGDLGVLKQTGVYTQVPGSNPLASRACGLANPWVEDQTLPAPGKTAFFLTTGVASGVESGLGKNSAGQERANANPCP